MDGGKWYVRNREPRGDHSTAISARKVDRAPEPSLYAFAYTIPGATPRPTFVVAGAGEMRERGVGVQGIVRHGETSPEAMREKAAHVMGVMQGEALRARRRLARGHDG